MKRKLSIAAAVASLVLLAVPVSAFAADATVSLKTTSIGVGVGGTKGKGVLTYKGHQIPFKASGGSLGEVGMAKMEASGEVENLTFLEKFNGCYKTRKAEAAAIVGKGITKLRNDSGVTMRLKSKQKGVKLSFAVGCTTMTLDPDALAKALAALNAPPVKASRQASIYFDTGSHAIRAEENEKLNGVIAVLKKTPSTEVIVTGYADTTGTEKLNQKLSQERAHTVFETLKERAQGTAISELPPERVEVSGKGQVDGPANTPDQSNRRVDILIISPSRASM